MPERKRYTNRNFTKRVDHEAGHAPRKPQHEPSVCSDCGAIYRRGHWTFDRAVLGDDPFCRVVPAETICPACVQVKSGEPAGFVFLDGAFVADHRDEILNLIRNEGKRAMNDNPLARIMDWTEQRHVLTVTTTTEHLAEQLGHSLKRAFDGDVRYDFSHENKLARVYWHRD